MRALSIGLWLLTMWAGLNLAVGAGVTGLLLFGKPTPILAMVLTPEEAAAVSPGAHAIIGAQAALANPLIVSLCALVLVLLWRGVRHRMRWALGAVAAALVPLQAAGFWSDAFVGHHNLSANVVSSVLLGLGLSLAWKGLGAPGVFSGHKEPFLR